MSLGGGFCSRIGDQTGSKGVDRGSGGAQRSCSRRVISVASGDAKGDGGRHALPRIMHHDIAGPARTSTSTARRVGPGIYGCRHGGRGEESEGGGEAGRRAGGQAGAGISSQMRGRWTAGAMMAAPGGGAGMQV